MSLGGNERLQRSLRNQGTVDGPGSGCDHHVGGWVLGGIRDTYVSVNGEDIVMGNG